MVANRITKTEPEPIMLCKVFSDKKLSDQFLRKDIASMSASESDANMMTQDSPQEAFAEERMHEGEDDTDVDEVNAELVEVEVLVKESSQVGRKELVKEVKKFLRSGAGASRRYLTGHFKISGTQQRLALKKLCHTYHIRLDRSQPLLCFVPESSWLN